MNGSIENASRRAERLVRCYPKEWRKRYGVEFTELLVAEITESPRSIRRIANVCASGLLARLTSAGLSSHALPPSEQARASLASFGCALAGFLTFGLAIWAQLGIGWQWSEPDSATIAAMVVMSVVMALFLALALLATIPIAGHLVHSLVRRRADRLARPLLLFIAAVAVLIAGSRHFGNGWPGTGAHPWVHQGLVPGGVAAFTWALTLSVTSYWAHPASLMSFPPAEIAWMVVSPIAFICAVVGVTKIIRRIDLPLRILRFEMVLAEAAGLLMIAFVGGASSWVVNGGGPRGLFHIGVIDVAGIAAMSVSIAIAYRAVRRARLGGGPALPAR
jgi:hypothetical protein